MRRELELKFKERWPDWFRHLYSDPRTSCLYLGFTHGDGWFDLVWQLCEQIEPIVLAEPGPEPFEVYQVKEKLGGLRFYNNHPSERIEQLCTEAAVRSFHVCEICGGPGSPAGRCEQHRGTRIVLGKFDNAPVVK
jgi:hypothetical protein